MPTIIIKTQAELDALPNSFAEFTIIEIHGGSALERIVVSKARGSSHVEARGSSHVEARGSSHVEAWESSHVEARESSHVEARESSHVVAWGSSHVVAWESSHVVAWGSCAVHNHSSSTTLELFGFAAAWLIAKAGKLVRTGANTTVIKPVAPQGAEGWLESEALAIRDGKVTLFKRVSKAWQTRENTSNETIWTPGATLEHPAWSPDRQECGAGKYHACSRGYFCDQFRSNPDDRYVAIEVTVADLFVWHGTREYPHKVAFRKGTVLHECTRYGVKMEEKK